MRIQKEEEQIKLYDIKTASKRLGVSQGTIYRLIRSKSIPHKRIYTRILFSENDLREFEKQCQVEIVK